MQATTVQNKTRIKKIINLFKLKFNFDNVTNDMVSIYWNKKPKNKF